MRQAYDYWQDQPGSCPLALDRKRSVNTPNQRTHDFDQPSRAAERASVVISLEERLALFLSNKQRFGQVDRAPAQSTNRQRAFPEALPWVLPARTQAIRKTRHTSIEVARFPLAPPSRDPTNAVQAAWDLSQGDQHQPVFALVSSHTPAHRAFAQAFPPRADCPKAAAASRANPERPTAPLIRAPYDCADCCAQQQPTAAHRGALSLIGLLDPPTHV